MGDGIFAGCLVRAVSEADLSNILTWRNHPDVRRVMLTRHEIGPDEHLAWFRRVSSDATRTLRIIEHDGVPIGYVQFSQAGSAGVVDWGFYAVPGASRGTGRLLGRAALGFCFTHMEVHKVCGQALAFNTASIAFHHNLGFIQEGLLRQHCPFDGRYLDLVCFGLLKDDWMRAEETEIAL